MGNNEKKLRISSNILEKYDYSSTSTENYYLDAEKLSTIFELNRIDATIAEITESALYIQYAIQINDKHHVNHIKKLKHDIEMCFDGRSVQFETPIPETHFLGIDVPKRSNGCTELRSLIESDRFFFKRDGLPAVIGSDLHGKVVVANIIDMPHLLVGGTTGTGKTVFVQSLLTSLLYKNTPEVMELFIAVSKKNEYLAFEKTPHLVAPIVDSYEDILYRLKAFCIEAANRLDRMKSVGVRKIDDYNRLVKEHPEKGVQMSRIVIIIDDIAEIMRYSSDKMQEYTRALTLRARAAGIHLIYVTSTPNDTVLTPVIRRNLMGRVAFHVAENNQSQNLINSNDAKNLLPKGDIIFNMPGLTSPYHVLTPYISDEEISKVVDACRRVR